MRVNTYLAYILKGGIILALFLPLFVPQNLFFPFITGKNFLFRAGIEILFALWVFLMARDKKWIPQKSLILFFVVLTALVLALSTIFGADPSRSFWSNYERMEGLAGHLHLLAYFLILISVFKNDTDWRIFFHTSFLANIFVNFYAVLQLAGRVAIHQGSTRIDATLGNATYMAVYLLFHLFFLLYFFLKTKSVVWRSAYAGLFALDAFLLYETATRGAILGFLGGLLLFALVLGFRGERKIYKLSAAALIVSIFIFIVGFYFIKDASWIKQNPVLGRFAALSLREQTTQSRLIIWQMAVEGWKERPVLGWGLENFNLVFNKHYDPGLWPQEPWFDRAHNVVFDYLIAGGILGLLSYLGIFFAAFYCLLRIVFSKKENAYTASAFIGLLGGYFFQNLFVFDQLISYILLFGFLAYIHYLYLNEFTSRPEPLKAVARGNNILANAALVFIVVLFIPIFYFVNIKPYMANRALINAIAALSGRVENQDVASRVASAFADFKKALAFDTFGNREAREQLSYFASQVAGSQAVSQETRVAVVNEAVLEMKKQITISPTDSRYWLFLSAIYGAAGQRQLERDALYKALEFSPKKQQILFALTQSYFGENNIQKALELAKEAAILDLTYPAARSNVAVLSALVKDFDGADKEIEALIKMGKADAEDFQKWGSVYASAGKLGRAEDFYKKAILLDPKNIQLRVSLSAVYFGLGRKNEAIKALEDAIAQDPAFKEQGESIILQISKGQKPF